MQIDPTSNADTGGSVSGTPESGPDRPIGRRAFLGLLVAGIFALFLGKDLFSWLGRTGAGAGGTGGFRINSVAPGEQFDPATWRLSVEGLFREPRTFTFQEFAGLPQVDPTEDFYCVEGWGVSDVRWKGVAVSELLDSAGVDPRATHLVFHSSDGVYTDSLTLEEARRAGTLLAHEVNGEPLPYDMGSPVRLIIPDKYAYKCVKWVVRVEAVALGPEGYLGYWERRGYPAEAVIR